MQTRVTKKKAVLLDGKRNYRVTWLLEVWPDLVPLTDPTIIEADLEHEFFQYDPERPGSEQDYIKQQERIDEDLKEQAAEIIDKYTAEKDLELTEARLDTAADDLKSTLDKDYISKAG